MKIGFIGFGNMAKAMLSGMISNGVCHKENVMVSGLHKETLEIAKNEFGVSVTLGCDIFGSETSVLRRSDFRNTILYKWKSNFYFFGARKNDSMVGRIV